MRSCVVVICPVSGLVFPGRKRIIETERTHQDILFPWLDVSILISFLQTRSTVGVQ